MTETIKEVLEAFQEQIADHSKAMTLINRESNRVETRMQAAEKTQTELMDLVEKMLGDSRQAIENNAKLAEDTKSLERKTCGALQEFTCRIETHLERHAATVGNLVAIIGDLTTRIETLERGYD